LILLLHTNPNKGSKVCAFSLAKARPRQTKTFTPYSGYREINGCATGPVEEDAALHPLSPEKLEEEEPGEIRGRLATLEKLTGHNAIQSSSN
jgi:hypothetical protein